MSIHGFPSINNDSAEGGGAVNYKGQYAALKFPKFVQQEYPKQVKTADGKFLGRAMNAKEEADILEANGLEAKDIDPMAAMQAELEAAKAKLALYEGADPTKQIAAKPSLKQTATVEMLPAGEPTIAPDSVGSKGNPLLKPAAQEPGKPQPQGSAPVLKTTVEPGV